MCNFSFLSVNVSRYTDLALSDSARRDAVWAKSEMSSTSGQTLALNTTKGTQGTQGVTGAADEADGVDVVDVAAVFPPSPTSSSVSVPA